MWWRLAVQHNMQLDNIFLDFKLWLWFVCCIFWGEGGVIPRHLNFMWRHFGTLCLFNLHRWCYLHHLWRWNRQSVPKCWHRKFRSLGITQKKEYNTDDICYNENFSKQILNQITIHLYNTPGTVEGFFFSCVFDNGHFCTHENKDSSI